MGFLGAERSPQINPELAQAIYARQAAVGQSVGRVMHTAAEIGHLDIVTQYEDDMSAQQYQPNRPSDERDDYALAS